MHAQSVMDEEASQAAYCLLAMSRGEHHQPRGRVFGQTVGGGESRDVVVAAAAAPTPAINTASARRLLIDDTHPSQFMIARILTDLTRVRQDLLNVDQIPLTGHQTTTTTRNAISSGSGKSSVTGESCWGPWQTPLLLPRGGPMPSLHACCSLYNLNS